MATWVRFDDAGKKWEFSVNAGGAWNDLVENPRVENVRFDDASAPTGAAGRGHIWHDSGDSTLKFKDDDDVPHPLVEKPNCQVYDSGAQVISTATWTAIDFDSEYADAWGFHDGGGANPERLTIPASLDGQYIVNATVGFTETGAVGTRWARIMYNGGQMSGSPTIPALGAGSRILQVTGISRFVPAVGGYFEVEFYQNSGGNISTVALYSRLSCIRIGDNK